MKLKTVGLIAFLGLYNSIGLMAQAKVDNLSGLSRQEYSAVEKSPPMVAVNKECTALKARRSPEVRYNVQSIIETQLNGDKIRLFTVKPRCVSGDSEMYVSAAAYWPTPNNSRFYDAGLYVSNSQGTSYLGKICQKGQYDYGNCSPALAAAYSSTRASYPVIVMQTTWNGEDLGGKYTDIYYSTTSGKNWSYYQVPDSVASVGKTGYCEGSAVGKSETTKDSLSDWVVSRKVSEYPPGIREVNSCDFPQLQDILFDIQLRDEIVFGEKGPEVKTIFVAGYAVANTNVKAMLPQEKSKGAFEVSSGTKLSLIARTSDGKGGYYWEVESDTNKRGIVPETVLHIDPSLIVADTLKFGAISSAIQPKGKWVKEGARYACYDKSGVPQKYIDLENQGNTARALLSRNGDRFLYVEYKYASNNTMSREFHFMAASGCKEIYTLPEVFYVDADIDLNNLVAIEDKWRASVYDSNGKRVADLGILNGSTVHFSPSGQYILATGTEECGKKNGVFGCGWRCMLYDNKSGKNIPLAYTNCTGRTVDDNGNLVAVH